MGLSEPWRFVTVDDPSRRDAVRGNFEIENDLASREHHGDRGALYARLKLEGLDKAPIQFAVFADPDPTQGHRLGRRTIPETAVWSAVLAVHTLWLAARSEGLGLGWVSILDPLALARTLDVPTDWRFIGYFCLGYPQEQAETPQLQRAGWERRRGLEGKLFQR